MFVEVYVTAKVNGYNAIAVIANDNNGDYWFSVISSPVSKGGKPSLWKEAPLKLPTNMVSNIKPATKADFDEYMVVVHDSFDEEQNQADFATVMDKILYGKKNI